MAHRPPTKLSREEKKIWKIVTEQLDKKNALSVLDFPSIVAYCKEMVLYYKCMDEVSENGSVIQMNNGKQVMDIVSPHYKNAKVALANAKSLADRFGLNSMSRQKLKMVEEKKDNDPLDDI